MEHDEWDMKNNSVERTGRRPLTFAQGELTLEAT